jgi:protein-export membrane protein SecD/preprotein translocase SecF subunit
MRRKRIAPLIFIVLVAAVALGAVVATNTTPQLGLDLQGGVSVVLQPTKKVSSDALDETISIIRSRVDALGVAEPDIARQGGSVIVQLPGVKNQQRALQLVGDTAELRFRPVISSIPGSIEDLLKQSSSTSTTAKGSKATTTSTTAAVTTTTGGVTGQSAGGAATPYQDPTATTVPASTATTAPTTATTATAPVTGFEVTPREKDLPDQPVVLTTTDTKTHKVTATYQLGPAQATGRIVSGASAELDSGTAQWSVKLNIKGGDGIKSFNAIAAQCNAKTETCPSGQLAIVLDSNVVSAPTISQPSYQRDQIQITGSFSQKEAKDLALVLRYGSLPVNLEPQTVQTVSPTLGSDSLRAGLIAGLAGLLLVVLYMLVYYRALGVVVLLGLIVWSALNYAVICWLGATNGLALGLSGVTGLVVSVGVTVDSYVVYFERLKEEVAAGRNLETATDRTFKRAFRTIIAANVSSLIGAVLLYMLTVGPVRGFAFFLGLATSLDVVVAWYFIRPMVGVMARNKLITNHRFFGVARGLKGKAEEEHAGVAPKPPSVWHKLYHGTTDVDFVGRFRTWMAISGVVLIAGGIAFGARGLNLGIDFEGGVVWEVPAGTASVADAESAVQGQGLKGVTVQSLKADGKTRLRVEAESVSVKKANQVTDKLASLTHSKTDDVSLTSVGPSWGQEISHKALRALIFFLIAITLYITFRFELRMAIPTLVALIHDVLITVGVYSIAGFQVTPATVVALLTILGFSIYDGIVVFDKVDELTPLVGAKEGLTYAGMVNRALNHVLMRSLNTSITALLPVASLLFLGSFVLGATTLEEFALALLIGLFAGAYSSIFIASPMLAWLKEKEPRYRSIRERVEAKQAGTPTGAPTKVPVVAGPAGATAASPATGAVGVLVEEATDESPATEDLPVVTRPAPGGERVIPPRPRKKGKKR